MNEETIRPFITRYKPVYLAENQRYSSSKLDKGYSL